MITEVVNEYFPCVTANANENIIYIAPGKKRCSNRCTNVLSC